MSAAHRRAIGALAVAVLGACAEPLDLPPIPDVVLVEVDPAVRDQLETARNAVDGAPSDPEAAGRLGMLYELYQFPTASRAAYGRAAVLAPDELRWRYYLGRLELAEGDLENAVGTLKAAEAIDTGYAPAISRLGEALLERGEHAEAEAAFRRALAADPQSVAAQLGIGRALAARGDHTEAAVVLERALTIAPFHGPLHFALGNAYRAVGRAEEAERHLKIATEAGAANPDWDPLLAAIADLEVGVDRDYEEAKRLFNSGRYSEAAASLEAVVEADPEHPAAWGVLGAALMRSDRESEALTAYSRAVEINPDNVDTLRPYSLLLLRNRRFGEAAAGLRKVLELGSEHPDDHHVLGAALMGLGRPSAAIASFERAIEIQPQHRDARSALVQVLWHLSSSAASDLEATPYLERLLEVEPRHLQAWTVLAGIREGSGDLDGALAAIERALEINPDLQPVIAKRDELRARRSDR